MKKLSILALIAVFALVVSCKKNNDGDRRFTPPTASSFKELRAAALAGITQTKTFDATAGLTWTSEKGTKLTISGGCLHDLDGNPITGDVTLSFIEIFDRGNMVATNKPLMGKNDEGDTLPLITGGEFFVGVKQGNKTLKSNCGYQMKVDASLTGGLDQDMVLWKGNIDEDGELVWEELERKDQGGMMNPNVDMATYDIFGAQFGWTNVDRFYNHSGPKTKIKVTVPEGYNNSNSGVYLSYEGEPGFLARLDTYDTVEKFFSEHYGFVPVGLRVHVIFSSENAGSVVYAIKTVTIANNQTINIADSDLNSTSLANLKTLINGLD